MPVRRLQPRDHAQWLSLRRRLWPDFPLKNHRIEMLDILSQPRRKAVFVFDDGRGRLGGFLEVALREPLGDSASPLIGYIEGWYVQPAVRRRGIGRTLMAAAEKWTLAHGLNELASCTAVTNRASIEAHRCLGFQESFRLVHFLKRLK